MIGMSQTPHWMKQSIHHWNAKKEGGFSFLLSFTCDVITLSRSWVQRSWAWWRLITHLQYRLLTLFFCVSVLLCGEWRVSDEGRWKYPKWKWKGGATKSNIFRTSVCQSVPSSCKSHPSIRMFVILTSIKAITKQLVYTLQLTIQLTKKNSFLTMDGLWWLLKSNEKPGPFLVLGASPFATGWYSFCKLSMWLSLENIIIQTTLVCATDAIWMLHEIDPACIWLPDQWCCEKLSDRRSRW